MPHYFENHPKISYDLLKNNRPRVIKNPLLRYKFLDKWKGRTAIFYKHNIEEGQTAQFIAHRFYNDVTLDWVIYILNDIIDPQYDWPMDYQSFINFIKGKYGSIETALNTVHHYEWRYQEKQVLYDGTIVPEKIFSVDATTYAGLPVASKREVSSYTYEEELNNAKRTIRVLDNIYLNQFLDEAESILQ